MLQQSQMSMLGTNVGTILWYCCGNVGTMLDFKVGLQRLWQLRCSLVGVQHWAPTLAQPCYNIHTTLASSSYNVDTMLWQWSHRIFWLSRQGCCSVVKCLQNNVVTTCRANIPTTFTPNIVIMLLTLGR